MFLSAFMDGAALPPSLLCTGLSSVSHQLPQAEASCVEWTVLFSVSSPGASVHLSFPWASSRLASAFVFAL